MSTATPKLSEKRKPIDLTTVKVVEPGKFYATSPAGFKEVKGRAVTIPGWESDDFFVYKREQKELLPEQRYAVVHSQTGERVGSGRTSEEAQAVAKNALEANREKYREAIKRAIAKNGLSPRYGGADKTEEKLPESAPQKVPSGLTQEEMVRKINDKEFSYVTLVLNDPFQQPSYIVFDPVYKSALKKTEIFAKQQFGDRFEKARVYPKTYLRDARVLAKDGKVIPESIEKPTETHDFTGIEPANLTDENNVSRLQEQEGETHAESVAGASNRPLENIPPGEVQPTESEGDLGEGGATGSTSNAGRTPTTT